MPHIYLFLQKKRPPESFPRRAININHINLCSGKQNIPNYWAIDLDPNADLILNLSKGKLPFNSNSIKSVICTSGINYFTYNSINSYTKTMTTLDEQIKARDPQPIKKRAPRKKVASDKLSTAPTLTQKDKKRTLFFILRK